MALPLCHFEEFSSGAAQSASLIAQSKAFKSYRSGRVQNGKRNPEVGVLDRDNF
jgi:hypothetical protein